MAWIETIDDADADTDAELAALYDRVRDPASGAVDEIMRVHSLHPDGLDAHFRLYRTAMRGTPSLQAVDRELIAFVVSGINGCHYWLAHHRRGLRRLLDDDALLERIAGGFESAGLDPRRLAMLRYVETLTRAPANVTRAEVDALRDAGFTDRDVLEICEVAAYYAYVNRIADGLGVQVEPWAEDDDGEPPAAAPP